MAILTGFEPVISSFEAKNVLHLHHRIIFKLLLLVLISGFEPETKSSQDFMINPISPYQLYFVNYYITEN